MKAYTIGLIIIILMVGGCKKPVSSIEVVETKLINTFPSGSTLEYYANKLYLGGDDAANLLIIDTNYNAIDSIQLFESDTRRIDKKDKADIEASTVLQIKNQFYLLLVGSGSLPQRENLVLLNLDSISKQTYATDIFSDRLTKAGIKDVNIEAAAATNEHLILANRGNLSNPTNSLVFTQPDFYLHQKSAEIKIAQLTLPGNKQFAGISGMSYIQKEDMLLFTASTELTKNSVEDGAIGDSYLGWIKGISGKVSSKQIAPDGLINLSASNKIFKGEKIESLCVSLSYNNTYTVHLVSDNDNGMSKLFKIRLTID